MAANEERESALKSLYSYRDKIRTDVQRLQEDLLAVERSIRILGGESVPQQAPITPNPGYEGLGIQAAVERLLLECPGRKFKPSIAAKELRRRGVPQKNKTFSTQVASALIRAAKKGLAEREKLNGRWVYSLKNKATPAPKGGDQ